MKKIILILTLNFVVVIAFAQSFSIVKDTLSSNYFMANDGAELHNYIVNTGTTPLTVTWRVSSDNTSGYTDWLSTTVCDNTGCYSTGLSSSHTCAIIYPGDSGLLKASANWTSYPMNATGVVHIRVTLGLYSKDATFIFNANPVFAAGISSPNENLQLSISPNPVSDIVTLKGNLSKVSSVQIINMVGRVCENKPLSVVEMTNGNTSIPVANLPEGVYFIRISNEDKTWKTYKLIKNHN